MKKGKPKNTTPLTIVFEKKYQDFVLDSLGKSVDSEGQIVEKKTKERVKTFEGYEIEAKELGAIKIGSQIYYKNDVGSVLKLYESLKGNGN